MEVDRLWQRSANGIVESSRSASRWSPGESGTATTAQDRKAVFGDHIGRDLALSGRPKSFRLMTSYTALFSSERSAYICLSRRFSFSSSLVRSSSITTKNDPMTYSAAVRRPNTPRNRSVELQVVHLMEKPTNSRM